MNKITSLLLLHLLTIQAFSQDSQVKTDWITQEYENITFQLPVKPQIDNQELILSNYKFDKMRFKSRGQYIECVLNICRLDTLVTADFANNYIKFCCEKLGEDFQGIEDIEISEGGILNTNETYRKSIKYSFYDQMIILNIFMNNNYLIEAVSSFRIGAEKYNDIFINNLKLSDKVIFE